MLVTETANFAGNCPWVFVFGRYLRRPSARAPDPPKLEDQPSLAFGRRLRRPSERAPDPPKLDKQKRKRALPREVRDPTEPEAPESEGKKQKKGRGECETWQPSWYPLLCFFDYGFPFF